MDEYWDRDDQWADVAKCVVCKGALGFGDLTCSATCSDIAALRDVEYA